MRLPSSRKLNLLDYRIASSPWRPGCQVDEEHCMSLGLKHGENRLSIYSDEWPIRFQSESDRILQVCGDQLLSIEHVGSTSVEGLVAKPIVDMVVGVEKLQVAENMIPAMQSIGYDYPGDIGIADDRVFGRDPGYRLYLVHVVEFEDKQWNRYIDFRHALRTNKRLAKEYGELKSEIAEKHPEGRAVYTSLKSDFINRVIEQHC